MPSPIGHSLVGIGAFSEWHGARSSRRVAALLVFLFVANLPDVDFVLGLAAGDANLYHHQFTHSLGFCFLAALILGFLIQLATKGAFFKWFAMLFVLLVSHLALDAITADTREPFGQPLFWPFSNVYVHSPVTVFLDVRRVGGTGQFFKSLPSDHNLLAVIWETIVLSPFCVWALHRRWGRKRRLTDAAVVRQSSSPRETGARNHV